MQNNIARHFGQLVYRLAIEAGYDLTPRGSGRTRLAEDTGMSVSAVGRMLRGETLPHPATHQRIAAALGIPVRQLLTEAGIVPDEDDRTGTNRHVRSAIHPPTPEVVADQLGITNPAVRDMLITSIQHAVRLQRDIDERGNDGGHAAAEG